MLLSKFGISKLPGVYFYFQSFCCSFQRMDTVNPPTNLNQPIILKPFGRQTHFVRIKNSSLGSRPISNHPRKKNTSVFFGWLVLASGKQTNIIYILYISYIYIYMLMDIPWFSIQNTVPSIVCYENQPTGVVLLKKICSCTGIECRCVVMLVTS